MFRFLPSPLDAAVSPRPKNPLRWMVLVFFLAASLLMGSGRFGSLDAGDQLQAAFYAVHHKQFGAEVPPGGLRDGIVQGKPMVIAVHFWWQAPNKLYYQTHDMGDVALFTPIAFVVSHLSHASPEEQIENPPLIAKLLISLLFSAFGGITAFFVYETLFLFVRPRAAFVMAALFLPTTFLWPFCKTVWDIAPAAMFAALVMLFCARILTAGEKIPLADIIGAGFAITLAASFRFSFVAFLFLAFALTLLRVYPRLRPIHYVLAAGVVLLGMLPIFASNQVRMGAFWHPATLIPRYVDAGTASMDGNFFAGFYGLTVSPNRGLFIYCPTFLLLFALPSVWKVCAPPARSLCVIFLLVGALYLCAIAKIPSWSGVVGWGPRYLVPVLPLFYIPMSLVAVALWESARNKKAVHAALIALFAFTALNNLPAALINWPLAITEDAQALDQNAQGFYAQRAMWRGFALGLQNKPLPMRDSLLGDARTVGNAAFPDLWLARLFVKGGKTALAGLVILLVLAGAAFASLLAILRQAVPPSPPTSP